MGNNNGNEKKEKVLRLDLSRSERAFEETECLWDSEISKMEERLRNHVATLKAYGENVSIEELPLLSIAIFGSPGSGKSSLLRTFVRRVKNDKLKDIPAKVASLPVIKPKMVAADESFLYAFLAAALKEDRDRNEKKTSQYRDSPVLSPLQQKFQEVSEYLQVINKPDSSLEDDPLGVSLERLERHESGLLLSEKMTEFIDELADTLTGGKEGSVVVLAVDDTDMSQDILVSTFDTCWRYLQHPRLVPVFTFTGRLAEELLRVHFEKRLNIQGEGGYQEILKEASTDLLLTETMAIQYMGKLFPVRNRIRLGPASARVLGANYKPSQYEIDKPPKDQSKSQSNEKLKEVKEGKDIQNLLKTVSHLLFGYASSFALEISTPLRTVTLRRQLQIVDAMQGAEIEKIEEFENEEYEDPKDILKPKFARSWAYYFDLATWSLLNNHRDILKEIRMNLDDLYGWTPLRLRRVVRDSILSLPLKRRRRLLTHWRYRTESRRSQMLSLLAANVFRPRMQGEEPTEDDLASIKKRKQGAGESKEAEYTLSFPVRQGVKWFLNLCIGFYLPQIMACNFPDILEEAEKKRYSSVDSITGVGWDFKSGPLHAIREAIYNKDVFFSGMVFIDCDIIDEIIKNLNREKHRFLFFWCYYGYHNGEAWAAVSLWRGLGLIGRLLGLKEKVSKDEGKKKRVAKIKLVLKSHIDLSQVIGNSPKKEGEIGNLKDSHKKFKPLKGKIETVLNKITPKIDEWLYGNKDDKPEKDDKLEKEIFPLSPFNSWESCFIRRLHGDNLLSVFWRNLQNIYFDIDIGAPGEGEETTCGAQAVIRTISGVENVIKAWAKILINYWDDSLSILDKKNGGETNLSPVQEILKTYPLIKPFYKETGAPKKMTKKKKVPGPPKKSGSK